MEDEPIVISDEHNGENGAQNNKSSFKKLLVIVIAVMLVGGLVFAGFKWKSQIDEYKQNQNDKDRQISELQKKLGESSESEKSTIYSTNQFTFQVPDGWSVDKQESEVAQQPGDTPFEAYIISNPKRTFNVTYTSGPGGLGGGCDPEEQLQQELISSQKLSSNKFAEETYYSELIAPGTTGNYLVWFGVSTVNQSRKVCEGTSYMVTTLTDTSDNIFFFGGGLTNYEKEFMNEADARAFFKSSDYILAKKMILSLKSK